MCTLAWTESRIGDHWMELPSILATQNDDCVSKIAINSLRTKRVIIVKSLTNDCVNKNAITSFAINIESQERR